MMRSAACGKCREDLCSLSIGGLQEADRDAVENHLASCADCQRYEAELRRVTAPLTAWEEALQEVAPSSEARMRWDQEFNAAIQPDPSTAIDVMRRFLNFSRGMVWPARRTWAGLAVVWAVVLGINLFLRTEENSQASSRPPQEVIRALLAREGLLAGFARPAEARGAVLATPPLPTPEPGRDGDSDAS